MSSPLLVVIAVQVTLVGLLLPAIQKVRLESNSREARHHLKQLGLATVDFYSVHQRFPPHLTDLEAPADPRVLDGVHASHVFDRHLISPVELLLVSSPKTSGVHGMDILEIRITASRGLAVAGEMQARLAPGAQANEQRLLQGLLDLGKSEIAKLSIPRPIKEALRRAGTPQDILSLMPAEVLSAAVAIVDADQNGQFGLEDLFGFMELTYLDRLAEILQLGAGQEDARSLPGVRLPPD